MCNFRPYFPPSYRLNLIPHRRSVSFSHRGEFFSNKHPFRDFAKKFDKEGNRSSTCKVTVKF